MKKIKLVLKYEEANEIYADLFNNGVGIGPGKKEYYSIMVSALLVGLYTKLAPKVMFRTDRPIKLSLDVATACALVVYVSLRYTDPTAYLDNIYLRLSTEIDQQLA